MLVGTPQPIRIKYHWIKHISYLLQSSVVISETFNKLFL